MGKFKSDKDVIVHEQPNGDLWVYQRHSVPRFFSASQQRVKRSDRGAIRIPLEPVKNFGVTMDVHSKSVPPAEVNIHGLKIRQVVSDKPRVKSFKGFRARPAPAKKG